MYIHKHTYLQLQVDHSQMILPSHAQGQLCFLIRNPWDNPSWNIYPFEKILFCGMTFSFEITLSPRLKPKQIISIKLPKLYLGIPGVPAKGLGIARFDGQQELITELPQNWGKQRLLEDTDKTLRTTRPRGKEQ